MAVASLLLLVIPVLLLAFLAAIGVYVYRDAKRRRMNAALWTLVALLAPLFVGLVIYLLARNSYPDLVCPSCAAPVTAAYTVCPRCGATFKSRCPGCGTAVEPGWSLCPSCALPLSPQEGITPPVRHKDRGIALLLLAFLLIPLLLFGGILIFGVSGSGNVSSSELGVRTLADYSGNPQVSAWLESCDPAFDGLYVLSHKTETEAGKETHYLIYDPDTQTGRNLNLTPNSGIFGITLQLRMTNHDMPALEICPITVITYRSSRHAALAVYTNGRKRDLQITEADFSLLPNTDAG